MDMKEPTVAISFSLRVWGKLPLSTAAAACDGIERSLRLVKNIYMSCSIDFQTSFKSAAAQESCHQTSSPRLLPVLPWLEVSSLRYAATRGNVDPQWRNPNLPEMAKFYIVLLYRTQETIQKLMITGPCKFQTHLSWSESLILTSRSRTNHSLCTSLSCQEGQPKRKFAFKLELKWWTAPKFVGSTMSSHEPQSWQSPGRWGDLVNKQKIYPMVCSPPHPNLWCSLYQFVLTKWSRKSRCLG